MARRDCHTPLDLFRCSDNGRIRAYVNCDGQVEWRTEGTGDVVPADAVMGDYTACTADCEGCPPVTAQAVQQQNTPWTLHDDNNDNYPQRATTLLADGQTVTAEFFDLPYTTSFPPAFGSTRSGGTNPFHNINRCNQRRTLGIARGGPNAIVGVRFTFSSGVTPYPFAITLVDFDGSAERWRSTFGDPTIMAPDSELQAPNGNAAANPANWIASTVDSPTAQTFVWASCRNLPDAGNGVVEFEIHDRNPAVMNVAIAFCPFTGVDCEGNPL